MPNTTKAIKDTVTLVLNGEVKLSDFSVAIEGFRSLIDALSKERAKNKKIDWIVDSLESGSVIATARGRPKSEVDSPSVSAVVDEFERVGASLKSGEINKFAPPVREAAQKIYSVMNGSIRSVRFETADVDVEIFTGELAHKPGEETLLTNNIGAVRGRVETLSRRGGLRFTLFEATTDRAVSCYLAPGFEDKMREAWGRLGYVEGIIRRDPRTGRPTTVRQVKEFTLIPEQEPGAWRHALSAAPIESSTMSSEEAVRRIRDG